jgi:hypothetical protein
VIIDHGRVTATAAPDETARALGVAG